MLLPFSVRARKWEPHAQTLRKRLKLSPFELLDPYELASEVGLRIVDVQHVCKQLGNEVSKQILERDKNAWSGGVFALPLPDGTRICILNPTHGSRRSKMTLMEEIAHVHLGHVPTVLIRGGDGLRMRDYNKAQEDEAFGVGAAALMPWEAFFRAINGGRTVDELAETYEVSRQLITYRVKITGAYKLYNARQRGGS